MQHIKLMDAQLREVAAGRAIFVPAPGLRREFQRAFVGEIRLHKSHASEFAAIDVLFDNTYARHQARAVAHGDGDAVLFFQRFDFESIFQRLCDGLLGVHMLAGLGHHLRQRQMLLVRHGQNHALDLGVGQHGLHIGHWRHPQFLIKLITLGLRAAIARDDVELA